MSVHSQPVFGADGSVTGNVAGLHDVHEQVLAREALARSERLFRVAMDGAPQGMAIVGLHLGFLQVNSALCAMLGRDESWLLSHSVRDVVHPDDLDADLAERDELISGRAQLQVHDRRWLKADGSHLWVVHSTALLRDEAQMPLFYVFHVQDNTDAHHVREVLSHQANHDPLTGLANRTQLLAHLAHLLNLPLQAEGPLALLFCDLDNFKTINDTCGHWVGDEVLRVTAHRIASTLRAADVAARLGGDEFVVVLRAVDGEATGVAVAEKIRAAVAAPMSIGADRSVTTTASVGIAVAAPDLDAHQLLRNADAALYEAKNAGRDRVCVFHRDSTL